VTHQFDCQIIRKIRSLRCVAARGRAGGWPVSELLRNGPFSALSPTPCRCDSRRLSPGAARRGSSLKIFCKMSRQLRNQGEFAGSSAPRLPLDEVLFDRSPFDQRWSFFITEIICSLSTAFSYAARSTQDSHGQIQRQDQTAKLDAACLRSLWPSQTAHAGPISFDPVSFSRLCQTTAEVAGN